MFVIEIKNPRREMCSQLLEDLDAWDMFVIEL